MVTKLFEDGLTHSEAFDNIVKEIFADQEGEPELQKEVLFGLLELFAEAEAKTNEADDKFINFVNSNLYMYVKDLNNSHISGMTTAIAEYWKDKEIPRDEIEKALNALINYTRSRTNGTTILTNAASDVLLGIKKVQNIINRNANKKAEV